MSHRLALNLGVANDAEMHHDVTVNRDVDGYFKAASGNASYRQMGADSGISYSTIRRQLSGEGDLTAHVVVALARTYNKNVLDALTVAGFITPEEAKSPNVADALRRATDLELAHEIVRRAAAGEAGADLTDPLPFVAPVTPLPSPGANVGGRPEDVPHIPENVEDEWAGRYAAHSDDGEPEDHTP